MSLTPFVGVGAGGRSYNHRRLDADATHGLAGYAAVGGELGMGHVHVRLEVRDYLTRATSPARSGDSAARNDVVVMLGLRFTRTRSRGE